MGVSHKIALLSVSVATLLLAGCQRSAPLARAGIAVHPPASWRPVEPSAHQVPGVALAAWAGPEGSSLSLYRTLPAPGGSPAMIAEALANRLENLPGMRRGRPSDGKGRRDDGGAGRGGRTGHRQRPGTERSRHTDRAGWQDASFRRARSLSDFTGRMRRSS